MLDEGVVLWWVRKDRATIPNEPWNALIRIFQNIDGRDKILATLSTICSTRSYHVVIQTYSILLQRNCVLDFYSDYTTTTVTLRQYLPTAMTWICDWATSTV
jgi:hypothetical protein